MQKSNLIHQYFAAAVVGLFKLSDGMLIGWVSPNLVLLKNVNDTILSEPLSEDQSSWLPTLMPIGSLIGILAYGFVSKLYGRKIPFLMLTIPAMIGWFLTCFAAEVSHLYIARLFLGFAIGGGYVIAPVYLVEISDDRIRGIMGASIMVNENTGVLLGYVMGGFGPYKLLPLTGIVLIVLFICLFIWLPETPDFLVGQHKMLAAEKSIRFYQNLHIDDKAAVDEIMDELKKAHEESGNVNTSRIRMSDITTRPGSMAMTIAIVLVLLNQGSGAFTLMNYSAEIFDEAESALSDNLSSVIVQAIQAIGTCFVGVLIEKGGRRFLYITSTVGCAVGYIVLGTYLCLLHYKLDVKAFNWVPLVSFAFVLFISSWAVASITFSVLAELMPIKLRELGVTVGAALLSVFSFAVLKAYPYAAKEIGVYACMYIFAGVCIMGAIFIFFALPEVKGKNYEEIMNELCGKKKKLREKMPNKG